MRAPVGLGVANGRQISFAAIVRALLCSENRQGGEWVGRFSMSAGALEVLPMGFLERSMEGWLCPHVGPSNRTKARPVLVFTKNEKIFSKKFFVFTKNYVCSDFFLKAPKNNF